MNDSEVTQALLPIYRAFEALREFEPTTFQWEAVLSEDGYVIVEFDGTLATSFGTAQETADYFRAEYWIRKVFGNAAGWQSGEHDFRQ